jgi:hypothetical protein
MIRLRSMALLMGVACTLGMFAAKARAGTIEMVVTEGATVISIPDNSALDTDPTDGVINVDTSPLSGINQFLVNYKFAQLGANSNSPGGNSSTGFVTQTGVAQLLLGGTGSITVLASDVDFNVPPAGPGNLHTSSTAEFANATNGNTNGFQGWYNPSNTLGAKEVPSPVTTFTATGQPAADPHMGQTNTPITLVNPYGLTNQTVITLTGGSTGALAQDRFGGTVQTFSAPIPEPASMALMLGALPVLVFGLMRRRRAAA